MTTLPEIEPACVVCGKPAACLGAYEGQPLDHFACDACCAHGNEDGHCRPVTAEDREYVRRNGRAALRMLAAAAGAAQIAGMTVEAFMEHATQIWDLIDGERTARAQAAQEGAPPC